MTAHAPGKLAAPAIFGSFDGMSSLIGVVIYLLLSHPSVIFPAALSGAVTSAVSMGGGEYLCDSDNGLAASLVMALATFAGALAPAIPFAFSQGAAAEAECGIICACVITAVAALRPNRGPGLAVTETAGLFLACAAVAVACSTVLPGGA
jgi:hypothetical protein